MNGFYLVDDKSGVGGHSIVKNLCCDLLEIPVYKKEIHRHYCKFGNFARTLFS